MERAEVSYHFTSNVAFFSFCFVVFLIGSLLRLLRSLVFLLLRSLDLLFLLLVIVVFKKRLMKFIPLRMRIVQTASVVE